MTSSYHNSFGSITTPPSPAEALARFSPLGSCGIVPIKPPGTRAASSRWHDADKNWWVEEGKATVFTRSISTSAILPVQQKKPQQLPLEAQDRLNALRSGHHEHSKRYDGYTPEQLAGYNLYSLKSKRLSSQEFGGVIDATPNMPIPPVSPVIPTVLAPPAGVVELEGSPPALLTARFAQSIPATTRFHDPKPVQVAGVVASPRSNTTSAKVMRKPVGSGLSPSRSRKSDELLIWTLEPKKGAEVACPVRGQTSRAYNDPKPGPQYAESASSKARGPLPQPNVRIGEVRNEHNRLPRTRSNIPSCLKSPDSADRGAKRPGPPTRFRSDQAPELANLGTYQEPSSRSSRTGVWDGAMTNALSPAPVSQHRQHAMRPSHTPHLNIPVVARETLGFDFEPNNLFAFRVEDIDLLRHWVVYALKLLFMLYLAACVWNVITSVKDGIVRALEPVFMIWAFVRWICGGGAGEGWMGRAYAL